MYSGYADSLSIKKNSLLQHVGVNEFDDYSIPLCIHAPCMEESTANHASLFYTQNCFSLRFPTKKVT